MKIRNRNRDAKLLVVQVHVLVRAAGLALAVVPLAVCILVRSLVRVVEPILRTSNEWVFLCPTLDGGSCFKFETSRVKNEFLRKSAFRKKTDCAG